MILLQAAMVLGPIMLIAAAFVFVVGMLLCVPRITKVLQKPAENQGSKPEAASFYRRAGLFIISTILSAVLMMAVCIVVLLLFSVIIGPIM